MLGVIGSLLCIVGFLLCLTDNPYNAKTKEYGIAWWRIFGVVLFIAGCAFLEAGDQLHG